LAKVKSISSTHLPILRRKRMVKEPINLSHFFSRWAVGVLVAVAALTFSLGNVQAQAQKALVDINSATQQELEAVKGVGAATAKKIIAGRPYKSLDELTKAGLSAKKDCSPEILSYSRDGAGSSGPRSGGGKEACSRSCGQTSREESSRSGTGGSGSR
jgi:predicted DNA-binding helix-hairpin-helix protein